MILSSSASDLLLFCAAWKSSTPKQSTFRIIANIITQCILIILWTKDCWDTGFITTWFYLQCLDFVPVPYTLDLILCHFSMWSLQCWRGTIITTKAVNQGLLRCGLHNHVILFAVLGLCPGTLYTRPNTVSFFHVKFTVLTWHHNNDQSRVHCTAWEGGGQTGSGKVGMSTLQQESAVEMYHQSKCFRCRWCRWNFMKQCPRCNVTHPWW